MMTTQKCDENLTIGTLLHDHEILEEIKKILGQSTVSKKRDFTKQAAGIRKYWAKRREEEKAQQKEQAQSAAQTPKPPEMKLAPASSVKQPIAPVKKEMKAG